MTKKKSPSGILIEIFARIWSFWGLISFAGTFLIIVIPSLLTKLVKDPKGMWWFISIARLWNFTWLHLIGCPVSVKGKENFAKVQSHQCSEFHGGLIHLHSTCTPVCTTPTVLSVGGKLSDHICLI
jgi:1-acyl-sn-glycerol-3-phosphate acyltransferase